MEVITAKVELTHNGEKLLLRVLKLRLLYNV